jgi:hypothetical protein
MKTRAIATLRTMMLWVVLLTVALKALPVVAADSSIAAHPYARRPSAAPRIISM